MFRKLIAFTAAGLALAAALPASAHDGGRGWDKRDFRHHPHFRAPQFHSYYRPAPRPVVVVPPPRVVYAPPPRVYYTPPPVYYTPPAYTVSGGGSGISIRLDFPL